MKVSMTGYGPPNLVAELRKARWSACSDGGQNFGAIGISDDPRKHSGVCMYRPADQGSTAVKVRVRNGKGELFEVEGFCSHTFAQYTQMFKTKGVILKETVLKAKTSSQNKTKYTIVFEFGSTAN